MGRTEQFLEQEDGVKLLLGILETVDHTPTQRLVLQILTDTAACTFTARHESTSFTLGQVCLRHIALWRSPSSPENSVSILIKLWETVEGISGNLEKHRVEKFLIKPEDPLSAVKSLPTDKDPRLLVAWLLRALGPDAMK